jgi:maltose/maltodextrin transport system permease protein
MRNERPVPRADRRSCAARAMPVPQRRYGGTRWLGAAALAGLLWLVFAMHAGRRDRCGRAGAAGGCQRLYVYGSARRPGRYLYPGVAGMLLFVAFPLLYTVQIGFTNYSSSNLLTEERARAYLLDQSRFDEAGCCAFTLHADGGRPHAAGARRRRSRSAGCLAAAGSGAVPDRPWPVVAVAPARPLRHRRRRHWACANWCATARR